MTPGTNMFSPCSTSVTIGSPWKYAGPEPNLSIWGPTPPPSVFVERNRLNGKLQPSWGERRGHSQRVTSPIRYYLTHKAEFISSITWQGRGDIGQRNSFALCHFSLPSPFLFCLLVAGTMAASNPYKHPSSFQSHGQESIFSTDWLGLSQVPILDLPLWLGCDGP